MCQIDYFTLARGASAGAPGTDVFAAADMAKLPAHPTAKDFMEEAVRLAVEGMRAGHGGPFGAVVVKDGKIVGASYNRGFQKCDPTAHAEVEAIRDACKNLGTTELAGCTIYSSGEPCPMCMGAIYWAQMDAVVFANPKELSLQTGFDDSKIYAELALPWKERGLSMSMLELDSAKAAFKEWQERGQAETAKQMAE